MGYLDQLANLLRGSTESDYAIPKQSSFDVMQKVAIPNYQVKSTTNGSHVNLSTPDVVYVDSLDAPSYVNPEKILNFTKAHELQHQIEGKAAEKGQSQNEAIQRAWVDNARQLGVNPSATASKLIENLSKPEVQSYIAKIGSRTGSRLRNPTNSPLEEILADIGGFQTIGKDLTKDPFLAKEVFNNPAINQLIKSTTGMSGVVIGDSDYTPYSLEASEAWNGPRKSLLQKLFK
jgi:hypothetical protein